MSSPSRDNTNQTLQRLRAHVWIDTNRIGRLEQELKALRIQLYALGVLTLLFAIAITMILVRATWHLQP